MGCRCDEIAPSNLELSPTCIGHLWIFSELGADDAEAFADAALRKQYARGDVIFSQGEEAEDMFLVMVHRA